MTDQHPITPPPELVKQWAQYQGFESPEVLWRQIATQAARWGADQELEACCEWIYKLMDRGLEWSMDLRAARRPKPPSLKEQAIDTLHLIRDHLPADMYEKSFLIRRALEQLDD